jgi:membrane protein implicated in regulation of membrane protease activity
MGTPTAKLEPDKQMPLTTRLWFSIAVLVVAALMPVNPLTVLLIFALAVDALVAMLLARDLGEGRQSVMGVDADAMRRRPED